jgi:Domain of unknown function (DUF2017)
VNLRRRKPLFERRRDGRYALHLEAEEREFLARLAEELAALLEEAPGDAGLVRLFPPAHTEDVVGEAEWQMLHGADLRASRRTSLEVLASTAERTDLDEDEVTAWIQALNAVRLVLGTRLDIQDDTEELARVDPADPDAGPDATVWAVYDFLSWLLDRAVRGLAGS